MITVNEKYQFERDTHGWQLHQWRDGVNPKTGKVTRNKRTTYHSNVEQVCATILDVEAGCAEDVAGVIESMQSIKTQLLEAIKGQQL